MTVDPSAQQNPDCLIEEATELLDQANNTEDFNAALNLYQQVLNRLDEALTVSEQLSERESEVHILAEIGSVYEQLSRRFYQQAEYIRRPVESPDASGSNRPSLPFHWRRDRVLESPGGGGSNPPSQPPLPNPRSAGGGGSNPPSQRPR